LAGQDVGWFLLASTDTAHQGFPMGLRYGALNLPGTLRFATVTLCLHFTLTEKLWFTTVVKGGEPAVASTV